MKQNEMNKEGTEQPVRGPALRDKIVESEKYGEEYRSSHTEDETQKAQNGQRHTSKEGT